MEASGIVDIKPTQKENEEGSANFRRNKNPSKAAAKLSDKELRERGNIFGYSEPEPGRQLNPVAKKVVEDVNDAASGAATTAFDATRKAVFATGVAGTLLLASPKFDRDVATAVANIPNAAVNIADSVLYSRSPAKAVPKVIMNVDSVAPLPVQDSPPPAIVDAISPVPSETPKKEAEAADIRSEIINKLLPNLSEADRAELNKGIDYELQTRYLKDIPQIIQDYGDYINMEAEDYDIPDYVIFGMLGAESRFDPHAVSKTGAVGIAQFTTGAASEVGLYDSARGLDTRDFPPEAVRGLAQYVAKNRRYFAGNLGFGIQNYTTGAGYLTGYTVAVTGSNDLKKTIPETNAYHIIRNVDPKNPDDKYYLQRVIAHAEEYMKFKQQQGSNSQRN